MIVAAAGPSCGQGGARPGRRPRRPSVQAAAGDPPRNCRSLSQQLQPALDMLGHTIDTPPASLITITPRSLDALDARLPKTIERVVLVEPDPEEAQKLTRHFNGRDDVSVIAAAVAKAPGPRTLQTFNFPGLRSLCPPTPALRQLLPGLRVIKEQIVETVTPLQLLERVNDLPRPLHVEIKAPGSEPDILEGWEEAGLERFDLIRINCGTEPLFEGAWDSQTLQRWALAHGFLIADINTADPDWPEITLGADHRAREFESVLHDYKALQQAMATAQNSLEAKTKRIADLEAYRAKQDEAIKTAEAATRDTRRALQQTRTELEARTGRMTELEAYRAKQDEAIKTTEAGTRDTQQALQQARTELEARTKRVTELEARQTEQAEALGDAEAAARQARQAAQQAQAGLDAKTKELDACQAKQAEALRAVETARTEVGSVRSDLAVALRLQMLAQSDLRELQDRYRHCEHARKQQEDLLLKLTPRLQQAARHLQQVNLPDDVPDRKHLASPEHTTKADPDQVVGQEADNTTPDTPTTELKN